MNKILISTFIGVIAGAIIIALFASYSFTNANGPFVISPLTANVSQQVIIGPSGTVQALATSSRTYALFTRDSSSTAEVYCTANGDASASTSTASFRLGTTTSNVYEMHIEKNPYDGAVRCYASASTTINVYELKRI